MRLCIQAGHSSAFEPFLPNGGGAPGEAAWTSQLARLMQARLEASGVQVTLVGHWYGGTPPAIATQDHDLFVGLHYDAAVYGAGKNTGCFADRGTLETRPAQADRFIAIWERIYPARTGIPLHNERRNPNTARYYAFAALSDATPGVLIEHGCGAPVPSGGYPAGQDAAYLHEHIEDVAVVNVAALLEYLGITHPQEDDMTPDQRRLLDLLAQRQITSPQQLVDLYRWGDQTAKDVEALRDEVKGLTDQLNAAPLRTDDDLAAVVIRRRGGQEQEIT